MSRAARLIDSAGGIARRRPTAECHAEWPQLGSQNGEPSSGDEGLIHLRWLRHQLDLDGMFYGYDNADMKFAEHW